MGVRNYELNQHLVRLSRAIEVVILACSPARLPHRNKPRGTRAEHIACDGSALSFDTAFI